MNQSGILFRHLCPYTNHQNGVTKRKHRYVVELGLTLLAQAHLPFKFWWDAFHTAVYHINRLPSATLHFDTPYKKLFNHKPDYNMLRCFGCCCYPYLRDYNRHKFDYHSSKCIFVGYSPSHKGYKCLHPSGKVYINRHVFYENTFPYSNIYESQKSNFCSLIHLTPQQVYHLTTLSVTPFSLDGNLTNPDSVSSNCSGSDHLVNSASTQHTIPKEPIQSHILPVQPTSSPSTSPNNQSIPISSNIQHQ